VCHYDVGVQQVQGVSPGSVGARQALLQGWLLGVGFVCLANVPDLVRWGSDKEICMFISR